MKSMITLIWLHLWSDVYNENNVNFANKGGKTGSVANRSGRYLTWNNVKTLHDTTFVLGDYDVNEDIGAPLLLGRPLAEIYDRNGISSQGSRYLMFFVILILPTTMKFSDM